MDASGYSLAGEMRTGFSISDSGVVSTIERLAVGRYEFIIIVTVPSEPHIFLFVGLVDVLSSSKCPQDVLYNIYVYGAYACQK